MIIFIIVNKVYSKVYVLKSTTCRLRINLIVETCDSESQTQTHLKAWTEIIIRFVTVGQSETGRSW